MCADEDLDRDILVAKTLIELGLKLKEDRENTTLETLKKTREVDFCWP
jgi:hypothetical protein